MTPAARLTAAIEVLGAWKSGDAGADRVLAAWGRQNRYAGSGDRRAIADIVYDALRRWRSGAWVAGTAEGPRAAVLGGLRLDGQDPAALFTGQDRAPPPLDQAERAGRPLDTAPEPVQLDLPDWLMPQLQGQPRPGLALLRQRAPVDLRVNLLKATPAQALAALAEDGIEAAPGPLSDSCLRLTGPDRRLAASRAYRDGLVELQDAASQAVADFTGARPGQTVLDFCAGGGGKTLALAARMANRGRLLAHDAAAARLDQLAPRARRAGARVDLLGPGAWRGLGPIADLTLVDAPCSGSGAWRRNPDARWRLDPARLDALAALQDSVLDQAAATVRPGGRLVYATCSLLARENRERLDAFLARQPGFALSGPLLELGLQDGGDGFFAAAMVRAR